MNAATITILAAASLARAQPVEFSNSNELKDAVGEWISNSNDKKPARTCVAVRCGYRQRARKARTFGVMTSSSGMPIRLLTSLWLSPRASIKSTSLPADFIEVLKAVICLRRSSLPLTAS